MVGLLNAPRGTKLYQRLKQENSLLKDMSGDNTDFSINFIKTSAGDPDFQSGRKAASSVSRGGAAPFP